jgi:cleavage and polyadenylation specificity factor subunit 1
MEVVAADFLPHGKQLYIMVADASGNILVLQFDPERKKL